MEELTLSFQPISGAMGRHRNDQWNCASADQDPDRLQAAANTAILDDQRIEAILHSHIALPQEKWEVHNVADLWLSADEALGAKLATEIDEFAPQKGEQLFYLGPP
jgi:ATP-dependent protease ClpP protease subunit